jgi:TusA-related sulfurtransferase
LDKEGRMEKIIDARGLSCPQPVLLTLDGIKSMERGEVSILVDTDTSKENVSRAAESQGWQVIEVKPDESGYNVRIKKE